MDKRQIIQVDLHDAWLSLVRHWFRSLLSTIGIAIGVASLVTMLSISSGAKNKALERAQSLGINTIRIENLHKGNAISDKSLVNKSYGLRQADLKRLTIKYPDMLVVGGFIKNDAVKFSHRYAQAISDLIRANESWVKVEGLQIQAGRYWNELDQRQMQRVCVAGALAATKLGITLGDIIKFNNSHCKVIGIQKVKGRLLTEGTGLSTIDFDNSIMMPLLPMQTDEIIGGELPLDGITALSKASQQQLYGIEEQIEQTLLSSHEDVQDFQVIVPERIISQVRQEQRIFSIIMGGIAGLSLLVGGVGIMNIMLANVAEQVREIGLRIALGATAKRIVLLFVATSVLLCVVGAILGLVIGVLLTVIIMLFVDWPISFSVSSIFVGPFFAIVAGVAFGIYPGITAISCDPATSLKEY